MIPSNPHVTWPGPQEGGAPRPRSFTFIDAFCAGPALPLALTPALTLALSLALSRKQALAVALSTQREPSRAFARSRPSLHQIRAQALAIALISRKK